MRTGLNLSVVIADQSGLENPSNLSTNTFATHNAVKWGGPLGGGALFTALIPHRGPAGQQGRCSWKEVNREVAELPRSA